MQDKTWILARSASRSRKLGNNGRPTSSRLSLTGTSTSREKRRGLEWRMGCSISLFHWAFFNILFDFSLFKLDFSSIPNSIQKRGVQTRTDLNLMDSHAFPLKNFFASNKWRNRTKRNLRYVGLANKSHYNATPLWTYLLSCNISLLAIDFT